MFYFSTSASGGGSKSRKSKITHKKQHKKMYLVSSFTLGDSSKLLIHLKVHKIEHFFGSEFEFYTISLLVVLKY